MQTPTSSLLSKLWTATSRPMFLDLKNSAGIKVSLTREVSNFKIDKRSYMSRADLTDAVNLLNSLISKTFGISEREIEDLVESGNLTPVAEYFPTVKIWSRNYFYVDKLSNSKKYSAIYDSFLANLNSAADQATSSKGRLTVEVSKRSKSIEPEITVHLDGKFKFAQIEVSVYFEDTVTVRLLPSIDADPVVLKEHLEIVKKFCSNLSTSYTVCLA